MAVKNNRIIESKHDLMDLINKVSDLWVDHDIDKDDTDRVLYNLKQAKIKLREMIGKNAYNQVYKWGYMAREATNRLLELIEEGVVDKDYAIMACVKFMSEYDVKEMCHLADIQLERFLEGFDDD